MRLYYSGSQCSSENSGQGSFFDSEALRFPASPQALIIISMLPTTYHSLWSTALPTSGLAGHRVQHI